MPDITKTDIGRRMYQLHKEKGVESVTLMIRESIGADWKSFTDAEIRLLERLIGYAWVSFDTTLWEKIPFNQMSREDIEKILAIGKYKDIDKTPNTQILEELKRVLLEIR